MNSQKITGQYGYGWDEHPNKEVKAIMNGLYGKPPEVKPNRQQRRKQEKLLRSSKVITKGHKK